MVSTRIFRTIVATAVALGLLVMQGCSGPSGPETHKLSGSVTYQGQPVPVGEVALEPAPGNSGPATTAKIVDGKYETEPDKGVVGGPYKVRIIGYDGKALDEHNPFGKPLFNRYEEQVDLPKAAGTKDFEVKASK